MNKPVTVAVLKSGIVPPEVLQEMARWGLPIVFREEEDKRVLDSIEEVIDCLREAVEGDDAVKLRDTDLDALRIYLTTQKTAKLTLHNPYDSTTDRFAVSYAVLPNGNYLIPWTDEMTVEYLTDTSSYLKVGDQRVTFDQAEELFFGGSKMFISAHPKPKSES